MKTPAAGARSARVRPSADTPPVAGRRSFASALPPSSGAPRKPFAVLVVALLVAGLVLVLLINTANAGASFRQSSLQQRNDELTLRQQQLSQEVDALDTPQSLSSAARRLGMVPGGDPAFLVLLPGGSAKVLGTPAPATEPPPPPPPPATSTPKPKQHQTHRGTGTPAHPAGAPHPTAHATRGGHR